MYKVIVNEKALMAWEKHTGHTISIWKNKNVKKHLHDIVRQLDVSYGAERDLEKDLGGYTIVLYGDIEEMRKEYVGILTYHHLQEKEYEYEYCEKVCEAEVVFRLYLCSSDYAVVVVAINDN